MIIPDLVARNAQQCPDHVAFVEVGPINRGRKETTWARFEERTKRLANARPVPRSPTGKIEKPKLHKKYCSGEVT